MSARSTYADEERERLIIEMCKTSTSTDPLEIFEDVASRPFVRMHGPEHHVLDGACLLATYRNAGGQIDLSSALEDLLLRGSMMPAAMCGKWGVCGAASSVGAALSLIEGTGPVSEDGTWEGHLDVTSCALRKMAKIGGPRCCKRDAYISLHEGVLYLKAERSLDLGWHVPRCRFHDMNRQCLKERCPFFPRS